MRGIANKSLESLECLADRNHSGSRDLGLEIPDQSRCLKNSFRERRICSLARYLLKTAARDDELADQRHQRVEALCIYSNEAMCLFRRLRDVLRERDRR